MVIRRATPADSAAICALAAANYEQNLSPDDRQQGFLSATFTLPQVADMVMDLGIVVATDQDRVVGFACASRCDWADQPPIVKSMVATFDQIRFRGRPLADYAVFVYGPVCLALPYRGRGLYRELYRGVQREVSEKYELGWCFVAEENSHSLTIHIEGLGMSAVGGFTHAERGYRSLVFTVETGPNPRHGRIARSLAQKKPR
jgi:hypothetical protein